MSVVVNNLMVSRVGMKRPVSGPWWIIRAGLAEDRCAGRRVRPLGVVHVRNGRWREFSCAVRNAP